MLLWLLRLLWRPQCTHAHTRTVYINCLYNRNDSWSTALCFCTVSPFGYPCLQHGQIDPMSQYIRSDFVYVFFAMGAARHILWPVSSYLYFACSLASHFWTCECPLCLTVSFYSIIFCRITQCITVQSWLYSWSFSHLAYIVTFQPSQNWKERCVVNIYVLFVN